MTRIETLSIIYRNPRVLLGMKKRGFGKSRYNGFGGRVEDGETLEQSAQRETLEEVGITILESEQLGKILFKYPSPEEDHLVYFFRVTRFSGVPRESDEMKPKWFDSNKIPYERMWEDDRYWLPNLLLGEKFHGEFRFDENFKIKSCRLTIR